MMLHAAMLLVSSALSVQAPSQGTETTVQTPPTNQPPASEKVVCKVDDEDTFSRIRTRVCKPESQWNRRKEKSLAK